MGKIKNCEYCGAQFEDKHRDGKRFCGRSCSLKFRIKMGDSSIQPGKSGASNGRWKGGIKDSVCQFCGETFKPKFHLPRMFCSKKCAAKVNRSKRLTPTQKELKTNGKKCETCGSIFHTRRINAKYCSRVCYRNNPSFPSLQGARGKGKTIPEWHRQAVSKATSARIPEKEFSYGKSGHHISAKAGSVFYRSSYEKIAYQILDADDKVISYQPEPFVIMYVNSEGNARRYRPDILVKKSRGKPVLIEVKPEWKMKDEKTILKIEAGKKYAAAQGWRFEVWTEKKLGL